MGCANFNQTTVCDFFFFASTRNVTYEYIWGQCRLVLPIISLLFLASHA
jgi:hypothetical protein